MLAALHLAGLKEKAFQLLQIERGKGFVIPELPDNNMVVMGTDEGFHLLLVPDHIDPDAYSINGNLIGSIRPQLILQDGIDNFTLLLIYELDQVS